MEYEGKNEGVYKMKYLIVVDMQKDFIDGSLGTSEAVEIVPKVVSKVAKYEGEVIFTLDI